MPAAAVEAYKADDGYHWYAPVIGAQGETGSDPAVPEPEPEVLLQQNGWELLRTDSGVILVRYIGTDTAVAIPTYFIIGGTFCPVQELRAGLFVGSAATTVTVPADAADINPAVFANSLVSSVRMGGGVPETVDSAETPWSYRIAAGRAILLAYRAVSAEAPVAVTIPLTVDGIPVGGLDPLFDAAGISAFAVEAGSTVFSADGSGVLFSADGKTLIRFPAGSAMTAYTVPEDAAVADRAFAGAANLRLIYLYPFSLKNLGAYTFAETSNELSLCAGRAVVLLNQNPLAEGVDMNTLRTLGLAEGSDDSLLSKAPQRRTAESDAEPEAEMSTEQETAAETQPAESSAESEAEMSTEQETVVETQPAESSAESETETSAENETFAAEDTLPESTQAAAEE